MDGKTDFLEYLIEADRPLTALYALSSKSDTQAIQDVVDDAALVYEALLAVQESRRTAQEPAIKIQMALDLLRAKLKSFGHPVLPLAAGRTHRPPTFPGATLRPDDKCCREVQSDLEV